MAKKKSTAHLFRKFIPLIVFVSVLSAALYVTASLSTRQGIAPNAPDSEPAASEQYRTVPCRKCTIYGTCKQNSPCNKNVTTECSKNSDCNKVKLNLGCGKDCLSTSQCAGGLTCATSSANPKIGRCINRGQRCVAPKVPGPNGCSCITPPTPTVLRLE